MEAKKSILTLLSGFLIALICVSAKMDDGSVPGISWNEMSHDFGKIHEGDEVETIFSVFNKRKDTLIIENVQGSCGCIVVNWSQVPVLPDSMAGIKVGFHSGGKSGKASKSVSVYTNRGLFTLNLKAEIIRP